MPSRLASPPLVGRGPQLARLRDLWNRALSGVPGVALVTGEAGSGKTRLTLEVIDEVSATGATVLHGECLPLGGHELPYGPFLGVLDDLLRHDTSEQLRTDLSVLLAGVETASPLDHAGDGRSGQTDRGRLFQRFLMVMTRLAEGSPVLLVLEDLHWADRSSLDLLAFLVAGLRDIRLMLVATARDDEPPDQALTPLLLELRRRGAATPIPLPPLEEACVDELLDSGLHLPAAVRKEVIRRADGNPFFALELGTAWQSAVVTLPSEVADAATARLRRLTEDARQVVKAAAAIGRNFTEDLLDSVLDLPEDRRDRALEELFDRGVLVADGERYRFRHALLQEAVYGRMLVAERRRVHRAVAPALQHSADERGNLDLETAIALSFHWQAAAEPGMALPAAVRAADLARRAHAYDEAARQAERAIDAWDAATQHPAGVSLNALLVQAAEDRRWAGDLPRGLAHATRAVALARSEQRPFAEQATALERLGQVQWATGDVVHALESHEEAVALARREGMTPVTASALAAWGTRLMTAGEFRRAIEVADDAVDAAHHLGLVRAEAHALITSGTSRAICGDLESGQLRLRRGRDLARSISDVEELLRAHNNYSHVLMESGAPEEGARTAADGVAELTDLNVPRAMLAALTTNLAIGCWRTGRWDEARAIVRTGLAEPTPLHRHYLQCVLTEMELARGDAEAARALLAEVSKANATVTDVRTMGMVAGLQVGQALLDRRTEEALRLAADAVRGLRDPGLDTSDLRLAAVCARALADSQECLLHPDVKALRAVIGEGVSRILAASRATCGSSTRARALAAQCDAELEPGDDGRREPRWRAAVEAWRAACQPYDLAYALVRHAEALTAVRRRKEAAEQLDEAESVLVQLGAAPLLAQARRLRRAAGLDPMSQEPAASKPTSADPLSRLGVTNRERQVLDLLARGKTNRQISRVLGMTERTAGTHVSSLLRKLGVTSRVEAASLAQQLR